MSHYQKVCEFGKVHSQCRCPGPKKTITIKCDRASAHQPFEMVKPAPLKMDTPVFDIVESPSEPYEPEADSLPERLDAVLQRRLWWMKTSERLSVLSDLMEEINKT